MDKKLIGDIGEAYAAELYEKMGFDILSRNYHSRFGEVDIIAGNKQYLCFIEVKTRNTTAYGTPGAYVDKRKQKKLCLTAMQYLSSVQDFRQPRFDVVELWQDSGRIIKHNLIENAFWAEDFAGQYEIF